MNININMNAPKKHTTGLSLIEILISIAIVSFVFIPAIQIVYSIQPKNILQIIRGFINTDISIMDTAPTDSITRNEVFERGDLQVLFGKGGLWNPSSVSRNIFSKQSCVDFEPNSRQLTHFNPQLFTYTKEELGLSTSTELTGIAIVGQKLYLSANSSSTTEPDIFIYNILSNIYASISIFTDAQGVPIKPTLAYVQSKDTGPGISSIQSRGTHIISANTGVKSQIDMLDNELQNQTSFVIPGSNSSTTPLTKVALYADDRLIVGTEKSILSEIVFFDIQNGQVLRTIETGYGINDMVLADDLLFVAGPRDPEIEVFDMDGNKIGQYDLPGGSGNAKALSIFGDILYVGRTKGGNEFVSLQINFATEAATATSLSSILGFTEISNKKINWSIDSMLNFNEYIALFTADEYQEFQLYKKLGVSQDLTLQGAVDFPARVNGSMCFRNTVWVTLRGTVEVGGSVLSSPALALVVF